MFHLIIQECDGFYLVVDARSNAATAGVSCVPSVMRSFARLMRFARSHGVARGLYRLCRGIADHGVGRLIDLQIAEIFASPVSSLKCAKRPSTIYAVRLARKEDLSALEEFFSKPKAVQDRWRHGDQCLIALAEGEICAAIWWMLGPGEFRDDQEALGCVFEVPEGGCWSYDAKGARFGAFGSLMQQERHYLEHLGAKKVWGQVDFANTIAMATNESAGFEAVGQVLNLIVLGRRQLTWQRESGCGWRRLPGSVDGLEVRHRSR